MRTHTTARLRALPGILLASTAVLAHSPAVAADWYEAMKQGTGFADFRLRYEAVDQDNALQDADALTLRTLVGYSSQEHNGWSFTAELEDVRAVAGIDDYAVPPTGYNTGLYSVIADPESTELHQGFIQYKTKALTVKAGRQVIALDGQRFIGHVGWRQNWQTFDALSAHYQQEDLRIFYSYIDQRNRIFADAADMDSKDHLLNASYQGTWGKLTAYAYLLETDNNIRNGLDTYGMSYAGHTQTATVKWLYAAEFATQTSTNADTEFDASYVMLEAGAAAGGVTGKINWEVLGSDDGAYGFATPLATLHKFNGWVDQFLTTPQQGLEDLSVSVAGNIAGGNWLVTYHDFSASESDAEVDDLGSEIDVQYVTKIADSFSLGLKYASYDGADAAVDTNKLWVWLGTRF
ncbi:alginate export family protein [Salinimonas sediminis]|uniref:Alginate export domain-containing protein n=1 Tax=Salinimonas sediminis TaxID=2303538 RepID=A0A346NNA3_9ALTE|nr:alginate export family protein [Salinimonas sediminis]AXR07010.1 hypothetical protein D0Y50_12015 [Salinimonas sediminis]